MNKNVLRTLVAGSCLMGASSAMAGLCSDVTFAEFKTAAASAYADTNGYGFGLPMWATLVNQTGKVCWVYSVKASGANQGVLAGNKAWLGSRVISAQKANTANAFSLNALSISTGALSVTVYPGGSLYGLQHSNPVDATVAYAGDFTRLGTSQDPLVGTKPGGINVFGGGVAVYGAGGSKVGAVGASGDTSCRDHTFAYRMRVHLGLDNEPNDDGLSLVDSPAALFEIPACGVNDPTATVYGANDDNGVR